MKRTQYIVEGANFVATVIVDEELFTNDGTRKTDAYMEAATKTIENMFRHGPDHDDGFNLLVKKDEMPGLGVSLDVCKNGDIGIAKKNCLISTAEAAENAGVLEVYRHFRNGSMRGKNQT